MTLSADELERYARHIVLPEVGGAGQQTLKAARVLVVGAGGLGSPILQYLAAAGVGTLGIVDDDRVSLSNLQRQLIHGSGQVGTAKVASAEEALKAINPHVRVETYPVRLDATNADQLVQDFDVVADGSDNFATRYVLADACEKSRKPLVHGSLSRFDGSVTVFMPHAQDSDGRAYPRYRDLFPAPPPPGTVPSCAEAGVLGVLPGVIGALQATEVLKVLLGIGEPLVGRLLLYDGLGARFETIEYGK
ncbi:MAG: molybdopterin-synthase adenylyltransferase MoeB [Methylobacterium mesophilicum]|nr:molybdopterin-synthase adenylyltransferase MoeB [Methylobacterium mesophilicum]